MTNLFIITAPSGVGKTSIIKELMQQDILNISTTVSHTTREPRVGEKQGVDYFFVETNKFKSMIKENEFVEHAKVFGQYYGTSKKQIQEKLSLNSNVILEIDYQGAKQVRDLYPNAISIFILPPDIQTIKQRLDKRGQDDEKVIKKRLQKTTEELSFYQEADYLIINDDFSKAVTELHNIILSAHNRIEIMLENNGELIDNLMQ
jgi:guanylate kinase